MIEGPKPVTKIAAVLLLLFASCMGAQCVRAQADCKVPYDAADKLIVTPHHSFQSHTAERDPGKVITTEAIYLNNGTMYVQVLGAWTSVPVSADELRQQTADNRKNARNVSCKFLRNETVAGETASVFQTHAETEHGTSEETLWISKSSGLPLKEDMDIDVGGSAGKSHSSIRYEYTNVSAPPVKPR